MRVKLDTSRGFVVGILLILLFSSAAPVLVEVVRDAEVGGGARHLYTFKGGVPDSMALYQGSSPDRTTIVAMPIGAEVIDFEVKLSGASSTGWSSVGVDIRDEWGTGSYSGTDVRSDSLSLAMGGHQSDFFGHSPAEDTGSAALAWLDNGSYSIVQPHLSNSSEGRFNPQQQQSSNSFSSQSQGAILKHHDWLFSSKWSGSSFSKVVERLWPNNATRESTITLEQANCVLPPVYSYTYYGMYGFRDWTVTPDERLYGILSGYRYHYGSSIQTQYQRIVVMDIRYDDIWTCVDSYDISPSFGDYSGIAYDRVSEKIWVVHNSQRRIVSYDFHDNGQFSRGSSMYTYQSSSTHDCGKSGGLVRGLAVHGSLFFMRCRDASSSWTTTDVLNAWAVGSTSSLVAQAGTRTIPQIGYGLTYDGERLNTVDCGMYTWGATTLYYRQYGSGLAYPTNPAPGTSTWVGEPIITTADVLSVNMETHWSATATGDRVDYWVSADNGTHWEAVESNYTIHFSHPGKELRWKLQLIGSSPVSWWVNLQYSTTYQQSGEWISAPLPTGTEVGKVKPTWSVDTPAGTGFSAWVSNDNGTTWRVAVNGVDTDFSNDGNILRYKIELTSNSNLLTPMVDYFTLDYLEGFPDRVELDIGDDGTWEWEGLTFLGDSSVMASDDSEVGVMVSTSPTLVQAMNDHVVHNGLGFTDIPIAVRAHSSGRILLTDLDISYRLLTRVLDANLEGEVLAPDGDWRILTVRVTPGDGVTSIDRVSVGIDHANGNSSVMQWLANDYCSLVDSGEGRLIFDSANCTSVEDIFGVISIRFPIQSSWLWDDGNNIEAKVTVDDNFGRAVTAWESKNLDLRIENDIQLDGMRVYDETGRELLSHDWVRGGYNLTFSGGIHFEGTQLSPQAGRFMLRIIGQNVTYDGDPIDEAVLMHEEANPSHGAYSMTFESPRESSPGGMQFIVEAYNMSIGSNYANPIYNTIRLILDGNSPLVLSSTPVDGAELHKGPPSPGGQAVSIVIQDSVDPPTQVNLNYWLGCTSRHEFCSDTDFDGMPDEIEYRIKVLTTPDTQAGGINIFEGLIDDSMLIHGEKVAFYVDGQDGQSNAVAMGGGPVCPDLPGECDWTNSLVNYQIREEFEPLLVIDNSTIVGHDDYSPLHPGIPYNLLLQLSDDNGWHDIAGLQLALAGDFDDDETSIWMDFSIGEGGNPTMNVQSGGPGIAVSNLYSAVAIDPENDTLLMVNMRFQLTWEFPEKWDTDGVERFIPKLEVWDRSCSDIEDVPCHSKADGLGNDWWSLDNDLRFDNQQGHITAIELRNGHNHYTDGEDESLIGAGQVLRFSGRVMFSEDSTPAPTGAFNVVIGDYENSWLTRPQEGGYFSLDFIVPSVKSGHLDLYASMSDLPGLATDMSNPSPRLRLAVDSDSPSIESVKLATVVSGGSAPLNQASALTITLETIDDNGFNLNNPALFHYVLKAGASEVSRGSISLDDYLILDDTMLWLGEVDLTDAGATRVLSTYTLEAWVTGGDAAGNPFIATGNTELTPLGIWGFVWNGPQIDLRDDNSSIYWDDPSPFIGQTVTLNIKGKSLNGVPGELRFILEENLGGTWVGVGESGVAIESILPFHATIDYHVEEGVGSGIDDSTRSFRLRMLDGDIELDRITLTPLLITEEVDRDWSAVSSQVSSSKMAVVLYLLMLMAASYGVWMMVLYRQVITEDEDEILDQTEEVAADMAGKDTPALPPGFTPGATVIAPPAPGLPAPVAPSSLLPPPALPSSVMPEGAVATAAMTATSPLAPAVHTAPPIPESGLPRGWDEEQWKHYGQKWLDTRADS